MAGALGKALGAVKSMGAARAETEAR